MTLSGTRTYTLRQTNTHIYTHGTADSVCERFIFETHIVYHWGIYFTGNGSHTYVHTHSHDAHAQAQMYPHKHESDTHTHIHTH